MNSIQTPENDGWRWYPSPVSHSVVERKCPKQKKVSRKVILYNRLWMVTADLVKLCDRDCTLRGWIDKTIRPTCFLIRAVGFFLHNQTLCSSTRIVRRYCLEDMCNIMKWYRVQYRLWCWDKRRLIRLESALKMLQLSAVNLFYFYISSKALLADSIKHYNSSSNGLFQCHFFPQFPDQPLWDIFCHGEAGLNSQDMTLIVMKCLK